jgi:hypothetical protein
MVVWESMFDDVNPVASKHTEKALGIANARNRVDPPAPKITYGNSVSCRDGTCVGLTVRRGQGWHRTQIGGCKAHGDGRADAGLLNLRLQCWTCVAVHYDKVYALQALGPLTQWACWQQPLVSQAARTIDHDDLEVPR